MDPETYLIEIKGKLSVSSFIRQWGGFNKKKTGCLLDGRTWDDMAVIARINGCIGSLPDKC